MATWFSWLNRDYRLSLSVKPSGFLLAALYAALYLLLREQSVDQWYLPAGLRVGALLLFPVRLWPYLVLGETAALLYLRLGQIEKYGLSWVIASSTTLMPLVAGIVYLHKRYASAFRGYWFISIAATVTVANPLLSMTTTYLFMPPSGLAASWERAFTFAVGEYLGILMLAPLALLWHERQFSDSSPRKLRWDAALALAVVVVLALYVHLPNTSPNQGDGARVIMAIPAIVLTCLHGWRGAAIGVTGVNLAIGLSMHSTQQPGSYDHAAFIAQLVLALSGSALLIFGAAVSTTYTKLKQHLAAEGQALALVKSNIVSGELEMRERAAQIRAIGEEMDGSFQNAVRWLRERGHHEFAMQMLAGVAQSRLLREQLSLIYPSEIETNGLYECLKSGAAAKKWEKTRRFANSRLTGDPSQLSLGLQLAAYRSVSDAVTLLLNHASGMIQVRARCGKHDNSCGIIINVRLLDPGCTVSPEAIKQAADILAGRAMVYGGRVQCRRNHIRLLLREPAVTLPDYGVPVGASMDQITPSALL